MLQQTSIVSIAGLSMLLQNLGVIVEDDHVVLTPKPQGHFHAPGYFNKDLALADPRVRAFLAWYFAKAFSSEGVQVVCTPTVGAISLGDAVSLALFREHDIHANLVYAEEFSRQVQASIMSGDEWSPAQTIAIPDKSKRVIKRGFPGLVKGNRVLVMEDVVSSGGSALATVNAVREVGGEVIGVGIICNRSGMDSHQLAGQFGVPHIETVFNIPMLMYPEDGCPLCKVDKQINIDRKSTRLNSSTVPRGPL